MTSKAKRNVYLCQVNHNFGNQAWLPYSVGSIQAYCQNNEEIAENFEFKELLFLREDPDAVARRLENPKVIGISCYIWNWEYSKKLAELVKTYHPECLIVLGGPHVPRVLGSFFENHPFVDLLVHFEGEIAFSEILIEFLNPEPNYENIKSLSYVGDQGERVNTPLRNLKYDLSILPSPYLSNVFDPLMELPYEFQGSQETHRGCPYSCTFCDWGSATMSKVRKIEEDRLHAELEWFGRNEIEVLYNCDANFGIFARDYDLAVKTVETKVKYGYPRSFRTAFAKNSNDRVFQISSVLNDAGMSKGATLSFQSMDAHTLDLIKRKNMKVNNFSELMKQYRSSGIPTYTELIIAMPGETYESFANGIDMLISAGQHDSLNIYVCMILPNSQLGDADYMAEHGVETVRVPINLRYSTPSKDSITEYHDIIISTKAMPLEDWKRAYMFSWAVQCLHGFNLTQFLSIFLYAEYEISYRTFYEGFLDYCTDNPDLIIGKEYCEMLEIVERVLQGGSWDVILPKFGEVVWPPEGASFLKFVDERDQYFSEMKGFVEYLITNAGVEIDDTLLDDVVRYQKEMTLSPYQKAKRVNFEYDLQNFFAGAYLGEIAACKKSKNTVEVTPAVEYAGKLKTFAQEVVWYGRKGGHFSQARIVPNKSN
ncbi:MAG: hypothetical protein HOM52_14505 [Rhodospirillaceae bacterium]|jgi:putative methyltransferase|nr:hypothetical protein [Rhodospirillaceae bacterium]MBT5039712.1 hypothetical protein [Rhodospirillaceae bacterium]